MTSTLLQSLRERILDEDEPLAGLLRKCLALGMETNSSSLRDWARSELLGYSDDSELPDYRKTPLPPIKMDSVSGNRTITGQIITRLQIPPEAREYVAEEFHFRQPVEELEELSKQESLSFTSSALSYAQSLWNSNLGPFQQIINMSFTMQASTITGILSKARTRLMEIIMDLTSETPLTELPGKDRVDQAVNQRIGTQYNTTIHATHGSTAIGNKAQATTNGITIEEAIQLLDAARSVASDKVADDEDKAELLAAIEELRTVVSQSAPDTGHVVKEVGKLRKIAERIGGAALIAAVDGSASALMELAMSGAFA